MIEEGKTIFEHLGIKGEGFAGIKRKLYGLGVYAVVGFIIGTIVDVLLGSGIYGYIIGLVFVLIWIMKTYGSYFKK